MPSMPLHLATAAASAYQASSLDEGVVVGDLVAQSGDPAAETVTSQRQRPKLSKLSSFECASLSSCLGSAAAAAALNPNLGRTGSAAAAGDPNQARLPDGYSQIFRSHVFGPSGFWTMAQLHDAAKFDSFLSLDCAPPYHPPWRNPRKGRDQILPSGNLAIR